jgi:hypothetical protein
MQPWSARLQLLESGKGKETTNKIKTEKNHVNLILKLKNITICNPRQWRQKLMWSFCVSKYINNKNKGKNTFYCPKLSTYLHF